MDSPGLPAVPPLPPSSSRERGGSTPSSYGLAGPRPAAVTLGAGSNAPESNAWSFMVGGVDKYVVGQDVRYAGSEQRPVEMLRSSEPVEVEGSEAGRYSYQAVDIQRVESTPSLQSPTLAPRKESWPPHKYVSAFCEDNPFEALVLPCATVFSCLGFAVILALALSHATSMTENSWYHGGLCITFGVAAVIYWVVYLKGVVLGAAVHRLLFVMAFTSSAFLAHLAYDTPGKTGQIQCSLLPLVVLSGDVPLAFASFLTAGVGWVFGWVVSSYTMEEAFTPTLLCMFLQLAAVMYPLVNRPILVPIDTFVPMDDMDAGTPRAVVATSPVHRIRKQLISREMSHRLPRAVSCVSPSSPHNNALRRAVSSSGGRSESSQPNLSPASSVRLPRSQEREREKSFFVASAEINTRMPTAIQRREEDEANPENAKPHFSLSSSTASLLDGVAQVVHATPASPREKDIRSVNSMHRLRVGGSFKPPSRMQRMEKEKEREREKEKDKDEWGGLKRGDLPLIMHRKSAEESKKDDLEAIDIVKSVVQMDLDQCTQELPDGEDSEGVASSTGAHSIDTLSGAVVPTNMKSLSSTILQKLVLLFTRLSEELDTFRIQRFICACVVQVLHCERASIFLCDWKSNDIWTISDDGHEIRVPMQGSLAGYAAIHGRVLNIRDAYKDARFNKDVDKNTGYITRNLLVYPITRGQGYGEKSGANVVTAVVEAINKTNGAFSAEDEGVLALLGKQAGIHLSNAQVYQQLQIEGLKTQSLLEVSKEINDLQIDLGAMVSKIMARARQVLHVERASIFLIDEQKNELWSILTDSETAAELGGDNVIRLPVGVGLAGHVAATGEVLNIPDAYACDMFNPEFDRKTGFVTKATLCVPVKPHHANKVMGVIQFINKCNGDVFSEQDVDLACSFSSFVGISLNNILMYDELREGQFIREKNKELVRLRDQAKQAAEAKSNFLMAMSHEIRTPMSGVVGMCELLMNTTLTLEQREMSDTIRSCGEALMAIINDVLDYGRLEAGKLELEKRVFGLSNIIEETIDVMRPKSEAKMISLLVDVDAAIPTDVIGDQYRLRQVLTNLLGNAVKFTPDGGDIILEVRRTASPTVSHGTLCLTFSVTDTGIGIDKEAQRKLFRPFEQADAGTTRQYGGSGLGLAICKQLVESMDGEVNIKSDLGKGSTFWFTASFGQVPGGNTPSVADSLRLIAGGTAPEQTVLLAISHERHRKTVENVFSVFEVNVIYVTSYKALHDYVLAPAFQGVTALMPSCDGWKGSSELTERVIHLPHHLLVDEELEGLTSDGTVVLADFAKKGLSCKSSMLMSMRAKSSFQGKENFENIFTKPAKMALIASLFSEKEAALTIKQVCPLSFSS